MPCDHPARSSHPFSPYPSSASRSCSRSSQPHLPRPSSQITNNNVSSTWHIQPGRYGLHQAMLQYPAENVFIPPQIQINGSTLAHDVPQQESATANVMYSQPSLFADGCFNTRTLSQPSPSLLRYLSSHSPSASRPHVTTGGIDASSNGWPFDSSVSPLPPPNVNLREPLFSQLVNQSSPVPLSTAHYHDELHLVRQSFHHNASILPRTAQPHISMSIPPQSAQVYRAPFEHSVDTQPHSSWPTYLPALRPQSAQVARPESQYMQPSLTSQQTSPTNQLPPYQQHSGHGILNEAHDLVMNAPIFINSSPDNFMTLCLQETIPGAEFDSSDPNMPLRCHPGTRSKIIKRCQDFILNREGRPKLRWVVGAAGVGKSAITQSVAHDESNVLSDVVVGATIFFSVNGRQDGTKAITTMAYQLAVKLDSYRHFVQREVTHDPSLLRKSLSTQFKKFIVEPFVHHHILPPSSRLLIIIDGLDECDKPSTQLELLGLILFFCIKYPSSPLVWIIASRPEPHITSFFSQPKVALSYEKEEILVDSDDAHEDVRHYLHDMFEEVRMTSIALRHLSQWPSEDDFSKIAQAAGGLFAYASTVVRYISDPTYGDPVSQLDDVLKIIEAGTNSNLSGENHPMAQLDALYARIMSRIPTKDMTNTRKLLLLYVGDSGLTIYSFHFICNMLGMTKSAAYGATHHIHSIARVPGPDEAIIDRLSFFHKSFPDYLRDFERSGFSPHIESETEQLVGHCGLRILAEAPDGVSTDGLSDLNLNLLGTPLKNGKGAGDKISVSWPAAGEQNNTILRIEMFEQTVWEVLAAFSQKEETLRSLLCLQVLTTCFIKLPDLFPLDGVRDFAFDDSRRRELLEHGILQQVPLGALDYDAIPFYYCIRLRFKGWAANPWKASCRHAKQGHSQDWSTAFKHPDTRGFKYPCSHCFQRFTHHFKMLPGHLVTVLSFTSGHRVVELRFVDPEDGVSEWTYHFVMGGNILYMVDEEKDIKDELYPQDGEDGSDEDESDEDESDKNESDDD